MYRLYECAQCGEYHEQQDLAGKPLGEALTLGDCRNDDNRYTGAEDFAERRGVAVADVEEIELPVIDMREETLDLYAGRLAAMVARLLLCADLNLDCMEDATYKLCDRAYALLAEATGCEYPATSLALAEMVAQGDPEARDQPDETDDDE